MSGLRAAAYLRVSTEEQALGLSLDSQRSAILSEASRADCPWNVVAVAHDHASGKGLAGRPGLSRLLTQLDAGDLDCLVVARFDRLCRSVGDFYALLDRASKRGWALVCLSPRLDMTTPEGRMFAGMTALFAQYERELIGQRQRESVAARRLAGTYRPPQPVVSRASVERMRVLRGQGASLRRIADVLTLEGYPAPRGAVWRFQTVGKILARGQGAVQPLHTPA